MAVFLVAGKRNFLIDAMNNDAKQAKIESLVKQSICDVMPSYPCLHIHDLMYEENLKWHVVDQQ